jgi:hypothetical protein
VYRHSIWYHFSCLESPSNTFHRKPPARRKAATLKYFCTDECEAAYKDKKFLYSKAVINAGLSFEGYKDSIRTNDGNRMLAYNKLHIIEFKNNRHHVYFRYCLLELAKKAGWSSSNCAFDLLHNSTVNLTGYDLSRNESLLQCTLTDLFL